MQADTTLHRALADGRRRAILAELESAPGGLDATELADRVGLHANTVRWHLGVLAGAGVVTSEPEPRTTPGRPRIVYRAERPEAEPRRSDEYRLLANILAGMAAAGPAGACEEAGRAWGQELVRDRVADGAGAVDALAGLLAEQGFEPVVEGEAIELHRCPFHDLAETRPDVVCSVHRGLLSGALDGLGSELRVAALEIFPRPGVCAVRLARYGALSSSPSESA
jgi:predicted ArsR family transcriptional regulator